MKRIIFSGNFLGILLGFTGAVSFFYYAIQALEAQNAAIALFGFITSAASVSLIVANIAEMRDEA